METEAKEEMEENEIIEKLYHFEQHIDREDISGRKKVDETGKYVFSDKICSNDDKNVKNNIFEDGNIKKGDNHTERQLSVSHDGVLRRHSDEGMDRKRSAVEEKVSLSPKGSVLSDNRDLNKWETSNNLVEATTQNSDETVLSPSSSLSCTQNASINSHRLHAAQYFKLNDVVDFDNVPKSAEDTLSFTFDLDEFTISGESLQLEKRLPVTCGFLREKVLSSSQKCEALGISLSSGNNTSIQQMDPETTFTAKWNLSPSQEGLEVYVSIMEFKPMESDEEAVAMKEGQQVEVLDASKPRRWLVRTVPMSPQESPKEGWVPACYLEKSTAPDTLSRGATPIITEAGFDTQQLEAMQKREDIVHELVETEEDFAKDLQFVVDHYYKQMDNPKMPKELRDRKGSIFGNFADIADFHNNVLMKGIHYHAKEPTKLGKTFLRLERDFDMHASYCWNEARAQRLLKEGPLKEYLEDYSKMIDDDKILEQHLKLPIQRLNDYQLLLRELIRLSSFLREDTSDLEKALEFIHGINKRTRDLQYIQAIQGCRGDLLKLGRIVKRDIFDVIEGDRDGTFERYVFLFKGRVFVTEKQIVEGKESFHVTNLFKLQDVEVTEEVEGDPLAFIFRSQKKGRPGFPLTLKTRSSKQKQAWIKELSCAANQVAEDLGDLEPSIDRPHDITDNINLEQKHKAEEPPEEPELKKPKFESLKRQDSTKKKSPKSSDSSVPQTPAEELSLPPEQESPKKLKDGETSVPQSPLDSSEKPLFRQDSQNKSKSAESSVPSTPTDSLEKPPKLSRQDSTKKKAKSAETPVPGTPTDSIDQSPQLSRQNSVKKSKSAETPAPGTPTDSVDQSPQLSRQNSVKKSKTAETPVPGTPTDSIDQSPQLSRQNSVKKTKSVESSVPQSPNEPVDKSPSLSRQNSVKKKTKSAESSSPQTPTEETTAPPALTRQDSVKRKTRRTSSKEGDSVDTIPEEQAKPKAQDSVSKKVSIDEENKENVQLIENKSKSKITKQDSLTKKEIETSKLQEPLKEVPSVTGENLNPIPTIVMSEDASGLDARFGSFEISEDNATLACESLKSDESVTPPASVGESAVLECETEGQPTPSVTWLRDNQKLVKDPRISAKSAGQRHSLTIRDATSEDGGLYTVVAANEKGSTSCSAPLNLKLPLLGLPKDDSRPTTPGGTVLPHAPVFKVKLNKETQLLEGTSVRFELVVRGNPEPQVKFFKNDKPLKLDDRVRVSYESKEVFELILDHVVAKDAGTYSCVATNREGEDKTVGTLSVVKHKDVFKGLEDTLEEEREPTPRPKTPKFKWFKDGQYFEANERFQVIFNEEEDSLALMFQHVTPEDAGLYTCVASTSSGSKIACSAELTVQGVVRQVEAPGIKAELSDVEASEGGSAMLELKITGYPKPKVTWFHKDKEVSSGGRYRFLFADEESFTLVIKNVKKDDSGKYSVKAVNEMGEAESSCNLSVKSAPSFVKGLKDMSVMAEEIIKFEVQIDGNPTPEVKWYKDGQQVIAGDRIKISSDKGKQMLQVLKSKPTDSGSYSCVLTNNLGSQAEFSNVVVKASPTFVKGMENVEGLQGDTLKFNVEINGNPKPTLKWLKDGKELAIDGKHIQVVEEGANTYSLVINKATSSDVGTYTCELRNEHGLKASSGDLNIKMTPEFVKKLTDMECIEGEVAPVMNILVKGYPSPTIKWLLEDQKLTEDKNYSISSEASTGSYTLKLKKVTQKIAGKYTCEASNEMGVATTSGVISVKTTTKKPEIDQVLKPTQLVEGKPGKLTAKVSGQPKPKVTWFKDGKPITPNSHYVVEEDEDGNITLSFDKVTAADAGTYSILASSDEGEAKSEAPVTTIPAGKKPEFVQELEKQDLVEGQPLQLKAKVSGKPTSIKWQKDGEDILAGDHVRLMEEPDGSIALLIDKVNKNDAGKYTVIASNAEGKARSASLVQVQAVKKPTVESSLEPLTLKDGETGELKAKISGEPKPTIKWIKDDKEMKPSNRVESIEKPDGTVALVIKNCRPEDAGTYTIVAENLKGEVKSTAPVVVNQAPTFQKQLGPVSVVEGYPAKLEAKLSGSPLPDTKWLKDGQEIVPDGSHTREIRNPDGTVALLIDNCKPEDQGKYSLIAKNPLGEDKSNGQLNVSAKDSDDIPKKPPSILTPLGNVSVKEGEPIRLEASISGNPLPDIAWEVNNKPLEPSDNTLMTFDGEKAILEIKRSSPEHMGDYKCKVSNPLGEASTEGSVSVQEKSAPRFIQRLIDQNSFVNQPIKLTCKVTGYPEPEVDWYFEGKAISPSNSKYNISKLGDTHSLGIHNCQTTDTGVYECRASNSVGEDHTRSAVDISGKVEKGEPPMFLKKIGDNEVMEGMTAKFTACITGIPTPDVSWVKEGKPLEPSPRHKMDLEATGILRLIIREVESCDYGDYSVTISNMHGSATSSARLIPDSLDQKFIMPMGDQFVDFDKFKKTGAPVPLPDKPRIIRMDDTSLTLGWKPSVPNCPRVPVTYNLELAKHPDGEWTPYKTGLKDTLCDVRDLRPGQDYKFRIRVENKHGVSDPSPYTIAHRSKIYEPPKPEDFKPKDYELEHPPLQKYAAPPRFVRKEEDSMYGVRGLPVTIEFWVYGHPQPQVTWFKGDAQIGKDKYGFLQDRNGKLCVFIDCMTDEHVGTYTCLAVNDEGEATMKIKLLIAETPVFIQKLDETTAMSRRTGRMQCRVTGLPYPKIKWFRDWHPLYESERIKILWEEPDKCTLFISNLISRDNALYSCTATNIAGTATSSASLNVEDSEDMFDMKTYCRPIPVRPRTKMFEDFYDIGDELGRGTQGITYHAVKRETGDSYAAKTMHGKGKLKDFMKAEMEIMNQLCHPKLVRLRDAFETKDTLALITDICGGGELLESIIKKGGISEREIAYYIHQVLEGLDYMHSRYIGHLGLTIGDVMVSRVNSYDIKCGDFSLSARLLPGKDHFLEYGHPEFVAPELANKQPATLFSDMWSVGVMTYLLLSGISPFLGENDRETLTRVQQGKINFIEDAFVGVSDDAKDFMSKLLVFDPQGRLDVKSALNHRWFKSCSDKPSGSETHLNNLDRLKDYQKKWKNWYANASCKRYFRRRTLESCFYHPSRMIYPPGESYTPPSSPEPELDRAHIKPSQFDDVTFKQKINREEIDFRSESNYQCGPDTYLLQLRDTDFPRRLREYLRVGASLSPTLAASLRDGHWGDSTLVIRERRKFVDVMDEEIDDERKGLVNTKVPRRLYHEIGTLGFAHEQMELLKKEVWKEKGSRELEIGMAPYFREKIRGMAMNEGEEIVFTCYAIGSPKPDYAWFRNDGILLESNRIVVTTRKDGRCELRINPARAYDVGVYKCVARNLHGVNCCRARLKLGSKPGRPEPPVFRESSDTEIYITWAVPRDEGNCTTLGYTLDYKKSDEEEWKTICNNIEHEYFVVRNLEPESYYHFRVKAYNKFGWGEPSFSTEPYATKAEGAPKIRTSPRRKYQQEFTERTPDYELKEIELPELEYNRESNPVPLIEGEVLDLYRIVSEMDRGRFSVVLNVWVKETNERSMAKVIQSTDKIDGKQEYEILKSLCHEKIVTLLSASFFGNKTVLILEKLSGVDVMSYLALRHDYNEELIVVIIKQVLEAMQYLHFRGICYLELQPDNVVMVNLRDTDIKLVDFASARFVPKTGAKVHVEGTLEYLAPEVIKNEEVSWLTDVWCVGVLTYILLSGVSPFRGKDDEETKENVTFVRYHFDNLLPDVTSEATRFLLNIFKQHPIKRLTTDECLEHKWLASTEYMMMKRESARFLPDKLAAFARKFHAARYDAMDPEMLTSLGMSSSKTEMKVDDFF
ncbi:obscurin-like isoform X2 [Uloborus diversus]|uniref:obscurin-like isoform X2 n=1 Tax=Uloborus diversus TaxID=327109 RepID=UPI00240A2A44|nr:obscurin-like isoform X2 [Uloborus diversus]